METLGWASVLALVTVWLGYPLGVSLVAACLRPRPRPSVQGHPSRISIIVASREPPAIVADRVQDLSAASADSPVLEIVVAVAGDTEPYASLLDGPVPVVVTSADPPGGKAAALNAAVRLAQGELLVFADTGQRFEPSTISCLAEVFGSPEVGAASGSLRLEPSSSGSLVGLYWRFERWLRRQEARLHSTIGVTGAVWAMRRSLWRPLPAGLILDDVYTPMRLVLAGSRIAFVEEARAWDVRKHTDRQEFHRKVRTLTGVFQLCHLLPGLLLPHRNPVWLQFVMHKLMRLLTPYLVLGMLAGIGAAAVEAVRSAAPGAGELPFAAAVLGSAALMLHPRTRRSVRELILLQAAVVSASANAIQGRWNVWR